MSWSSTSAIILALLCSACASTKPVVNTNVKIDFPSTAAIESVEQANAVLDLVTLSRAQIEWRYRQKEQICFTKFFTNYCISSVQEERRIDLALVKKSEVAANYFIRKNNVEEMDKALIEKYGQPLPGAAPVSEPEPDNKP